MNLSNHVFRRIILKRYVWCNIKYIFWISIVNFFFYFPSFSDYTWNKRFISWPTFWDFEKYNESQNEVKCDPNKGDFTTLLPPWHHARIPKPSKTKKKKKISTENEKITRITPSIIVSIANMIRSLHILERFSIIRRFKYSFIERFIYLTMVIKRIILKRYVWCNIKYIFLEKKF